MTNVINSNEQMIEKINEVLQNKKNAVVNIVNDKLTISVFSLLETCHFPLYSIIGTKAITYSMLLISLIILLKIIVPYFSAFSGYFHDEEIFYGSVFQEFNEQWQGKKSEVIREEKVDFSKISLEERAKLLPIPATVKRLPSLLPLTACAFPVLPAWYGSA